MPDAPREDDPHARTFGTVLALVALGMAYGALLLVRVVSSTGSADHAHGGTSILLLLASVALLSLRSRAGDLLAAVAGGVFACLRVADAWSGLFRGDLGGDPGRAAATLLAVAYALHLALGAIALGWKSNRPSLARAHWTALAVLGLFLALGGVW